MSDVEEIKRRLDLVEVINETVTLTDCGGGEWKGAINPGSQSGKSLNVNRDMQVWYDWASGTYGDVLAWIALANNLDQKRDFKQILTIAAEKAGIQLDTNSSYNNTPEIFTILRAAAQWYHNQLTPEHRSHITDKWGISNDTIDKYLIGYAPGGEDATALQVALSEVFTVEDIRASGLFVASNNGWVAQYQDRIVFPYWKGGAVVYSIARSMEENTNNKYVKQLTNTKQQSVNPSIKNVIFGQDSLKGADHCIITEGVTDCLMVLQAGIPCISPVTVRFQDADHTNILKLVKDLKTVYICNDNEVSGIGSEGAQDTADLLKSKSVDVRMVHLPLPEGVDKIDLADFLRDNPVDAFNALMDATTSTQKDDPDKPCKACRYHRDGINGKGDEWARCALDDVFLNPYRLQSCEDWEARPEKNKAESTPQGTQSPYFDFRNKFIPKYLGDEFLQLHHAITMNDTREIAVYQDGVYVIEGGEDLVRVYCLDKLGDEFKRDRINEVLEYIRLKTLIPRSVINQVTWKINVKNGMYDVDNDALLPHSPKYFSTIQLPITYDPKAQCEAVDKFLYEVASPEDVLTLVQYSGYCCTTDIRQQKALLLDGAQNNGKSTFIELVSTMIGQDHVSEQRLQDLNNDRFSRAQLNGKLLNMFPDLPKTKLYDNSVFKMLTSDQWIDGEEKYIRKFRFRNTTKQLYSANKIPEVDDPDELAFFRRWMCITFPESFEGRENTNLLAEITTDKELSGFFNICMVGLRALREHSKFCYNKSVSDVQKIYLTKSDPVQAFLDECTEYSIDSIKKVELYAAFEGYCENNGITNIIKENVFGRKLKKLGYEGGRLSPPSRATVWINVGVVVEGEPDHDDHTKDIPENAKDKKTTLVCEKGAPGIGKAELYQDYQGYSSIVVKYKEYYSSIYDTVKAIRVFSTNLGIPGIEVKTDSESTENTLPGMKNNPGNNPGKTGDQAERLNKLKAAVERYQTFNKCILDEHNYKYCAAEYIRLNPDQNYDQTLTDLQHGWGIDDKDTKSLSAAVSTSSRWTPRGAVCFKTTYPE